MKSLYCMFFSGAEGMVYPKWYPKKLKKCYHKRRSLSWFGHVYLFYDNASLHTSELVKHVLNSEKIIIVPHPPNISKSEVYLNQRTVAHFIKTIYRFTDWSFWNISNHGNTLNKYNIYFTFWGIENTHYI